MAIISVRPLTTVGLPALCREGGGREGDGIVLSDPECPVFGT